MAKPIVDAIPVVTVSATAATVAAVLLTPWLGPVAGVAAALAYLKKR